ncbi:LOW QUALITY PROTEIN: ADAM 17-like protease [Lepeophtheirus salmonis]|uniref:LOW QUALITY PROTEIN: ADAM 17-like protease n=1 Tax=Lepeophtheirus salmonis TaxID=72036 RepID=UPI003AF33916
MIWLKLLVLICLQGWSLSDITKNLRHFEILSASDLSHSIVKRGLADSNHQYNKIKEVGFKALGREFRLLLSPKTGLLHKSFKAVEENEDGSFSNVYIDPESFYQGRVFGELSSNAVVHFSEEGILTAKIQTSEDTYHVEPAWRFLSDSEYDLGSKMIAYKESDALLSWNVPHPLTQKLPEKVCDFIKEGNDSQIIHSDDDEEDFVLLSRSKRHNEYMSLRQTRCPLLLVADYRFYKEMGGSSSKTTVNYLISLIDRVHKIYEDTIWKDTSGSSGFSGMGFIIKKILVHRKPTLVQDGQVHYNMEKSSWDVRNLLEVFSRDDSHKHFCLAHLFTDIKFEGGILGLAYVGSPRRNSVGGICTPEYFKNSHTLYLNSGLSSSRNHYGQRVITREADLVTAHEFGHNWGSEHDPDSSECSPSASQGGSYLMYTYSVSGYDINNKKFSPCSLRFIRKVLLAKSSRCFSEPEESFCGNLRVEGDEECDAGLLGSEDTDACCDENCKLRPMAKCSDKNSPCCESCNFVLRGAKCRAANLGTCEQESHCTGDKASCPTSRAMRDGTQCLEKGECRKGECVPYCEIQGKQSCMCDTKKNACKRCCRERTNSSCYPALDQRGMEDQLPDGTPCYQGFCNKGICERTMQDVVERIWDFIEDFNINSVLKFLKDNVVGVVVFISLLFWIPCSCLISYVDRKRAEKDEEEWKWMTHNQLIHPRDNRRIVEISVPRSHTPCNGRRDLNRDHYHPSRNRLSAL